MLSELGLSSFAELGQAVALAFHRGEPFRPVSGPALPTSGPPVASAPPVPPAAPAGLSSSAAGLSSSAAAIQMSARQWASGPSVSAPADFTNASVEQQCPGVTTAARSFLAGSSSALPQEAVAASILPGGHVQLSAPSFSVPATVKFASDQKLLQFFPSFPNYEAAHASHVAGLRCSSGVYLSFRAQPIIHHIHASPSEGPSSAGASSWWLAGLPQIRA